MDKRNGALECRHHWLIDSVRGPTSLGRCQYCAAERSFLNLYDDVREDIESRKQRLKLEESEKIHMAKG